MREPLGIAPAASGQEIPVLNQYVTSQWTYFADERDAGLCFEWTETRRASNVWVAASLSPIDRKIKAKVETWIDRRSRPHSLDVLRAQLEFNDFLAKARHPYGPQSSFTPQWIPKHIKPVPITGILERMTLLIPVWRAEMRLAELGARVDTERASAMRVAESGPVAGELKKKYADFITEKIRSAATSAATLEAALRAIALRPVSDEVPLPRYDGYAMSGLDDRDLSAPYNSGGELIIRESRDGFVRFGRELSNAPPEDAIYEFVDQRALTAGAVDQLKRLETSMIENIETASNICKDLFTPPCP